LKRIQAEYNIPQHYCFTSYTDLIQYCYEVSTNANSSKNSSIDFNEDTSILGVDAILLCIQDQMHCECTVAFANLNKHLLLLTNSDNGKKQQQQEFTGSRTVPFHILLEKPMAVSLDDCQQIVDAVESVSKVSKTTNMMLAVCHVMRYSLLTQRLKSIVNDSENNGGIGKIMNIQHLEPVGHWHFAHSFVRGNWRNEQTSTFMLMSKACHDMDWVYYMMKQEEQQQQELAVTKLNSYGSLLHFNGKNKPTLEQALKLNQNQQAQQQDESIVKQQYEKFQTTNRCLDCPSSIESQCPYSAKRIYLERVKQGHTTWPVNVIISDGSIPDIENVTEALQITPYGLCVYSNDENSNGKVNKLDNNVCDQQVVMMEFNTGATATISVVATTHELCQRKTRIFGTHGEIDVQGHLIRHVNFKTNTIANYDMNKEQQELEEQAKEKTSLTGHGHADYYLMKSFIEAVANNDESKLLTNARETLLTHRYTFDAENSRKQGGKVIEYQS